MHGSERIREIYQKREEYLKFLKTAIEDEMQTEQFKQSVLGCNIDVDELYDNGSGVEVSVVYNNNSHLEKSSISETIIKNMVSQQIRLTFPIKEVKFKEVKIER